MSEAGLAKLAIKLGDEHLAVLLYKAGYRNPTSIRRASDKELKAIGVEKDSLKVVRAVYRGEKS